MSAKFGPTLTMLQPVNPDSKDKDKDKDKPGNQEEEQKSRSQLRRDFLTSVSRLCQRQESSQVRLFSGFQSQAVIQALDRDSLHFCAAHLKTPTSVVVESAKVRATDVDSIVFARK